MVFGTSRVLREVASMANTDRPDVEADRPWRDSRTLKALYDSMPEGDARRERLGRVLADDVRSDRIVSTIRQSAEWVLAHPEEYSAWCRGFAVTVIRKTGRAQLRTVAEGAGKKKITVTVYPGSVEERDALRAFAESQGMSLAAWSLSVLREAAGLEIQGE